jgi:hypothetical protein
MASWQGKLVKHAEAEASLAAGPLRACRQALQLPSACADSSPRRQTDADNGRTCAAPLTLPFLYTPTQE